MLVQVCPQTKEIQIYVIQFLHTWFNTAKLGYFRQINEWRVTYKTNEINGAIGQFTTKAEAMVKKIKMIQVILFYMQLYCNKQG